MNSNKKKKSKAEAAEDGPTRVADDEDDKCEDDSTQLKPARPKIGESKDNLKQRSDWFQKRSGRR